MNELCGTNPSLSTRHGKLDPGWNESTNNYREYPQKAQGHSSASQRQRQYLMYPLCRGQISFSRRKTSDFNCPTDPCIFPLQEGAVVLSTRKSSRSESKARRVLLANYFTCFFKDGDFSEREAVSRVHLNFVSAKYLIKIS